MESLKQIPSIGSDTGDQVWHKWILSLSKDFQWLEFNTFLTQSWTQNWNNQAIFHPYFTSRCFTHAGFFRCHASTDSHCSQCLGCFCSKFDHNFTLARYEMAVRASAYLQQCPSSLPSIPEHKRQLFSPTS